MPYDPDFIPNVNLPLPILGPQVQADAYNNGTPVDHTRFSIIFNEKRGFAAATAHNIDGESMFSEGTIPRKDAFRFDKAVPNIIQIDNDQGYVNNPWDRGHLVRRASLHWGDLDEAKTADKESYFWTNIAPQHENLHDTAWGNIEDWMFDVAVTSSWRACVFTGPVLTPNDPERINKDGENPFKIPAGFWKIIALMHSNNLLAAGFLTWQRDFDKDSPVQFDPILEQVRLTTIEYLTGLGFPALRAADPLKFGAEFGPSRAGRHSMRPGSAIRRPAAVTQATDIVLG